MCVSRERRKDPVKAAQDRATSRKWKAKHPTADHRPGSKKRGATDRGKKLHLIPVYPYTICFCPGCGIQMLDPDDLCGFCRRELDPCDKLRLMELFPGQDEEWKKYFSLLSNRELNELYRQAHLERLRRLATHIEEDVLPKMTKLYRTDGRGNPVGPPAHHRRPQEGDDVAA